MGGQWKLGKATWRRRCLNLAMEGREGKACDVAQSHLS